jgi:cell division protein FtsI (penicillin-binding protein 3)
VIRPSRVGLVHGAFLLFAAALVCRAAQVQLVQTSEWRAKARHQQVAAAPLPAPRGMILDASGALLVESRPLVMLSVAPREVAGAGKRAGGADSRGLAALARALAHARVSSEWIARATDTSRAWVEIPGRFLAADVSDLTAWRGVHTEQVLERVPPAADGLRRLIGRADGAGEALDGMEKSLDLMLRGESGRAALLRDSRGRRFDSPGVTRTEPRTGSTVTLTINQTLQDIAERALGDAVKQMGATGGDIVMLDPLTGEVRAMASRRADPLSTSATALTEPYEPGSTLKPFVAARLLDLGRARVDEVVNTYNGKWELNGRKIEDDHPAPSFSLADVIRFSSNIGIVQFAQRFSPREQYELLRDVGFGVPTGLPYPAEESGRLPSPGRWDKQTPASLAMGYALNVTPLQLAIAYAAIANGGELLEPAIVREIRSSDGVLAYRHERRVVRRVMSDATARTVRGLLRGVVESGTGESASLATFDVAGKTGTAKRTEHGRYVAGKYTASFVGLFPADHPRMVILVKLDNPSKSIYGAKAAAPVTKTVLQAAIAAREASLDRRDLAAVPSRAARAGALLPDSVAHADSLVRVAESGSVPYVYRLGSPRRPAAGVAAVRAVPDVRGLPVRRAVYALHRAGFRVTLGSGAAIALPEGVAGDGAATGTVPSAGALVTGGSTIRLARAP